MSLGSILLLPGVEQQQEPPRDRAARVPAPQEAWRGCGAPLQVPLSRWICAASPVSGAGIGAGSGLAAEVSPKPSSQGVKGFGIKPSDAPARQPAGFGLGTGAGKTLRCSTARECFQGHLLRCPADLSHIAAGRHSHGLHQTHSRHAPMKLLPWLLPVCFFFFFFFPDRRYQS